MCNTDSVNSICQMNLCAENQPCSEVSYVKKSSQCNSKISSLYKHEYTCNCERG